jgi:hypothetical protein
VKYTIDSTAINLVTSSAGPATPTFDSTFNGYTIPHSPVPMSIPVSVEYSLVEDGTLITSGTGTYNLVGSFDPILAINTDAYPASVRPVTSPLYLSADTSGNLAVLNAPSGAAFTVGALSIVPEPWQYGAVTSLGLLFFAAFRRSR